MAEIKVPQPNFGIVSFTDGEGRLTTDAIAFLEALYKRTGGGNDIVGNLTSAQLTTNLGLLEDIAGLTLAKGDIVVYNGSNLVKLAVGADTTTLTADSAEATGLKWV